MEMAGSMWVIIRLLKLLLVLNKQTTSVPSCLHLALQIDSNYSSDMTLGLSCSCHLWHCKLVNYYSYCTQAHWQCRTTWFSSAPPPTDTQSTLSPLISMPTSGPPLSWAQDNWPVCSPLSAGLAVLLQMFWFIYSEFFVYYALVMIDPVIIIKLFQFDKVQQSLKVLSKKLVYRITLSYS